MRKLTKDEFIDRSNIIHNKKYKYDDINYIDRLTKIDIVCPIHGKFPQTPAAHLQGQGCPECGKEKIRKLRTKSQSLFIEQANKVHNNKYDYSKVKYEKNDRVVTIICPIHGEFEQTPRDHLDGYGCHKCSGWRLRNIPKTNEDFVKLAKKIHNGKYDYSKTDLTNKDENGKVIIICPMHGEFKQAPYNHIIGGGCRKCANMLHADKKRSNTREFIEKSKKLNGNKYDYSKIKYVDDKTPVILICPIHGEFEQTPNNHLTKFAGCPACNESKLEKMLGTKLIECEILHKRGKKFKWLGYMHLDFFIPKYNIAIECQGVQHFMGKHFFESLDIIQERDKRKKQLCEENEIKLIYFLDEKYNKFMSEGDIYFNDTEKLIEYLKTHEMDSKTY